MSEVGAARGGKVSRSLLCNMIPFGVPHNDAFMCATCVLMMTSGCGFFSDCHDMSVIAFRLNVCMHASLQSIPTSTARG